MKQIVAVADKELLDLESEKEIVLQLRPQVEYWKARSEGFEEALEKAAKLQKRLLVQATLAGGVVGIVTGILSATVVSWIRSLTAS